MSGKQNDHKILSRPLDHQLGCPFHSCTPKLQLHSLRQNSPQQPKHLQPKAKKYKSGFYICWFENLTAVAARRMRSFIWFWRDLWGLYQFSGEVSKVYMYFQQWPVSEINLILSYLKCHRWDHKRSIERMFAGSDGWHTYILMSLHEVLTKSFFFKSLMMYWFTSVCFSHIMQTQNTGLSISSRK